MRRRSAVIGAGIAAGLAAGMVGGIVARRHRGHDLGPIGDLPPEDLGSVASFDGTGLAVRAAGDPAAPVILLAHGFSLDMSVWCRVWPELAREARVVTMDFRSHGASERPATGDLTLRAMGRDVAAVLDDVSPERPAIVVGHSMGAMAILALAEQRPELFGPRIAGIALIGAAASDLLRGAMGSVTGLLRPRFGSIQTAALRVDRVRRAVLASPVDVGGVVTRLTQFGPDTPKPVVDHVVGLARSTPSEVWTDTLPELMEMDLRHAAPRVRVPALVLVGEEDRVTPPAAAVALAAALPEGRLVVLEGAGHIPMLDGPDLLERELAAFARSVLEAPKPKRRRKPAGGEPT
ncbi:MAG TPA: alpha/beta hydrolase [Actinomycetota bacterium]|nr:alpha/beta hydrolase [Actinomycetota bacterium]